MLGNPANSCVQIHPAIDGPFPAGLPQRTDNTRDGPENLSIRRDAIDHKLMELGRLHQLCKRSSCLVHIFSEGAQLLEVLVDLGVRAAERILRLQASIDGPDVVPLDEAVNEHVPQSH
ncbi:hypothetical protein D3C72_2141750 [compost metagenome]